MKVFVSFEIAAISLVRVAEETMTQSHLTSNIPYILNIPNQAFLMLECYVEKRIN